MILPVENGTRSDEDELASAFSIGNYQTTDEDTYETRVFKT